MWLSRGSGAPHNDDVYEAGITSCFTKDEFMLKWSVNVTFMWFVHLWVFIISLKEVVEAINECRTTPRTTGYSLTKTQRWTFKEQHLLWNIPEGCLKKSKSVQDVLKHTFGHNKCWLSFCLICWFFLKVCKRFVAHAHVSHFPSKTQGDTRLFHSTL